MVGIPHFYVDGQWGGNVQGWGGGGSSVCCIKLPAQKPSMPYLVKVQWRSCDISHIKFVGGKAVDPDAQCVPSEHEATVPVHYVFLKGHGGAGLKIHFVPGNKVEITPQFLMSHPQKQHKGITMSIESCLNKAPAALIVALSVSHYRAVSRRLFMTIVLMSLAAYAQGASDKLEAPDMVATTLTGVGHLGGSVGISEFYVNGRWGGSASGWGGGGGSVCCIQLPAQKPVVPYLVTVKWTSCDVHHIKFINGRSVDPDARCIKTKHEATVPVHYTSESLDYVQVHFLPGNKVEVWSSNIAAWGSRYPGPAYSRGPAPDYAPVPDESSTE
eukprot:gene30679-39526_t